MAAVDMYEYPEMVSLVQDGVFQSTLRSSRVLGTLAMNGMHSLYQLKNEDGSISIVFDDIVLDKKLDEIRETYIDLHGGYAYFGRLQGETQYCLFTRYKGDICGLDGYMNPFQEADGEYIVFAGLKKGVWSLYRGITPFIASMGYENRGNISHDYFFADNTQPRYYMFVEHTSA